MRRRSFATGMALVNESRTTRRVRSVAIRLWAEWPRWTLWGGLLWSAVYAIAGILWSLGADWYPFAVVDPERASSSLLEGSPVAVVGPAFAVGGSLGVVAASALLLPSPRALRRVALVVAIVIAIAATVIIPDYIILAALALWPLLVVFVFTGVPGTDGGGIEQILYPHRINLIVFYLGGLLWAAASLAEWRRQRVRCVHCGRPILYPSAERDCTGLRRIGTWFVWIAFVSMVPYDATRIAWFFGWPLGLSEQTYGILRDPPWLLAVGLGLALLSTAGAVLTHAFVAGWGERFPRWTVPLAGRPVPVMLAVAPATLIATTLPSVAVMVMNPSGHGGFDAADWGTWLPGLLMVGWAIGLGGSISAYYLRRRGRCRHCGGGERACPEVHAGPWVDRMPRSAPRA